MVGITIPMKTLDPHYFFPFKDILKALALQIANSKFTIVIITAYVHRSVHLNLDWALQWSPTRRDTMLTLLAILFSLYPIVWPPDLDDVDLPFPELDPLCGLISVFLQFDIV
jgi:hypothetical protein